MKQYANLKQLLTLMFRQNSQDITVQPNTGTTYTASRSIQLSPGDSDQVLVSADSTQTLTNKSISGSTNTITNVSLTAGVTGVLPVANGGTNSNTSLSNNRIMKSSGGAIVEAAAITAARVLISDANGIPTHATTTTTTLGYLDATSSIQTQLDGKIKADGTVPFTGEQSMGGFKLTSVADPTVAQDAATKNYVDLVAQGVGPKKAVRVASTANIASLSGLLTIDTITVSAGDRVLVKDQTTTSENGIYVASASAWSRATDFDTAAEINGSWVGVQDGTSGAGGNKGKVWIQVGTVTTVGTDPIVFTWFNDLTSLVGGDMITVSAGTISVDLATTSGLVSTNPGNVGGQLKANVDASTIDINGSNQLIVKSGGITNTQVSASAAIDATKIAAGTVGNTQFGYISGLTSDAQTQLTGKAAADLSNLTVSGLASQSLLVGSSSSAVAALAAGSNGQVLTVVSGNLAWSAPSTSSFKTNWLTADGTSKTVTHSLGTLDIKVEIYDTVTGETIGIDSIVRTSTSVVTLTATEAPGSNWRVLVSAV